MQPQSFKNHIRFYAPHHFIFYPVLMVLVSFAVYRVFTDVALREIWIFIAILLLLTGWLSYMLRQHYALTLQDRLVRLEMRHKYFVLTGKDFEPLEAKISFGQIAALRFAPDEELEALVAKAIQEHLSPRTIKTLIQRWKADAMRV
ncbi:DUF6526 family protein [Niabella soli]|uniref:Uncharacterized protein n=1 Tax=Niabella soli DSM 19437 TaxID=929713 RepID=W0EYU8_9BACT|nr:DUF6526 family protein [Niabella soli]AHF14374.1 hypothetical protein NIASO_02615 [Niabella soli DSM 19437]